MLVTFCNDNQNGVAYTITKSQLNKWHTIKRIFHSCSCVLLNLSNSMQKNENTLKCLTSRDSFDLILVQLTIFGICFLQLGYLIFGHLLSGSILNHLMHSKDAECILIFLSAMPRGVSVAHIYVLKLPLHHL